MIGNWLNASKIFSSFRFAFSFSRNAESQFSWISKNPCQLTHSRNGGKFPISALKKESSLGAVQQRFFRTYLSSNSKNNPQETANHSSQNFFHSNVEKTPIQPPERLSSKAKLKHFITEYGPVGFATYIGVSLVNLGLLYMLVSFGFDFSQMLNFRGFSLSDWYFTLFLTSSSF
eukprot:Sdes_comp15901_c0_seq1m5023